MAVRKLGPHRYEASWRDGAGREKTKVLPTRQAAFDHLAEVRPKVRSGAYVDPKLGRVPFRQFAQEWAATQEWKATTVESWPYHYARLDAFLGDLPLAGIDSIKLAATQKALSERYARATVTVAMSYARAILRTAYQTGRIPRDPTIGLAAPRARADARERVGPDDVPTRAEVLAILGAAPMPFRAAIALGVAGLRVGEVLAVNDDRFDLERRRLTVDRQVQRIGNQQTLTTPKAEKVRTITLPGAVAFEVRRHLRDYGGGFLFVGGRTGELMRRDQFYDSAWRPALVGAGLARDRFVFHSLRHFCASSLLADGASLTAVAGHLGDTVETVSRTYVHWLRDDRDVPAMVLDRILAADFELVAGSARGADS